MRTVDRWSCTTLFLAIVLIASPGTGRTEDAPGVTNAQEADEGADKPMHPSVSVDATFASRYLFQGFDYSDGKPVLQPEMIIGMGPFAATVWANQQPNVGQVNEIDISLKYTAKLGEVSIAPGYTNLSYPNRIGWEPSQEMTFDVGVTGPLSPTLSLHYDFGAGDGLYSTLGLTQSIRGPLAMGLNVFYEHQYYGMSGIPATELKASASFSVGTLSVTPSISRFFTWANGDFRDAGSLPSNWLFAFNVGHTLAP